MIVTLLAERLRRANLSLFAKDRHSAQAAGTKRLFSM